MIIFILLLSMCIYYLASSNCCRAVYRGRWVAFVAWGTGSLQISITAQPCLKQMNSVIVNGGLNNQKKRSSGQKKNPQPLCPPQPESLQPQRPLKEIFLQRYLFYFRFGETSSLDCELQQAGTRRCSTDQLLVVKFCTVQQAKQMHSSVESIFSHHSVISFIRTNT